MKPKEINEAFDLGATLREKFSTMVDSDHGGQKKYCGIAAILAWMAMPLPEREKRVKAAYRAKRKEWHGDPTEMQAMVAAAIRQAQGSARAENQETPPRLARPAKTRKMPKGKDEALKIPDKSLVAPRPQSKSPR